MLMLESARHFRKRRVVIEIEKSPGHVPRVAVIGGGFSGLAAAHRLHELSRDDGRPVRVTLFEASRGG